MNLYSYVRNNPFAFVDPLGLCLFIMTTVGNTQDGYLQAISNSGSQQFGRIDATNRASGNGPIPKGFYQMSKQPARFGIGGASTPEGFEPSRVPGSKLTQFEQFGNGFLPIDTPNLRGEDGNVRTGIGIHATGIAEAEKLKGTIGYGRNCTNEPNFFIKQ